MRARPAALAGTFYPADPARLRDDVDDYLTAASESAPPPKAIVAPHAGYVYSGPIAGSAYAPWRADRERIERIVLLGPAHRVHVRGLCAPTVDAFESPLGPVPLDRRALDAVAALPQVSFSDAPHAQEHSLETQLPFLQRVLGDFTLVPFVVGAAEPREVAEVLARLWGGEETRIVVSSDLSHFHDYETARAHDGATRAAIEALDPNGLGDESACGRVPLRGLLTLARERGLTARTLDVRNSGDTAGDRDRVVGYGAFAFGAAREASADLDAEARSRAIAIARASVTAAAAGDPPADLDPARESPGLRRIGTCFVTLRASDGSLRGCVGSVAATRPLAVDLQDNARRAALRDPRFSPVTPPEVADLEISVSVLSAFTPLDVASEAQLLAALRPRIDGLMIQDGARRAVFLPQVWEQLPDPRAYLDALRSKAGIAPGPLPESFRAQRFTVQKIE